MISKMEETVRRSYGSKPKYQELMPGFPEDHKDIKTLGDLLKLNYKHAAVESQLRGNLVAKLKKGENPLPGIIGYDDDVIPAICRAILAGHDLLLVGQIGQAKTKMAEALAESLLSPIPVVRGTITNDIPTTLPEDHLVALLSDTEIVRMQPEFVVSPECEDMIRTQKLETRIDWVSGRDRFKYILSTPDISVKDLVGQIDAIKIAKKGVELYSIESYSAGQLLQARHGILCIDELPVLDPRKQVSLLSVLQEGRFTTGAYPVVFRPDVKIVATANPTDYTHSGKIIEPLFDRLRSHVDTHYPKTITDEMMIMIQEAKIADPANTVLLSFIVRTVARIVQMARSHQEVNQEKGVSVRMSVHSLELLAGEAERTRSISLGVKAVPRFCDMLCIHQSSKFELSEMEDTRENRKNLLDAIIDAALKEISLEYVQKISQDNVAKIKNEFAKNKSFLVSQVIPGSGAKKSELDYESQLTKFPGLKLAISEAAAAIREEQKQLIDLANQYGIKSSSIAMTPELDGEFTASVAEVVLEGLRHIQPPLLDRKDNSYGLAQ